MIFNELYKNAPLKLKFLIDQTKKVEQNLIWHPENFVYNHTKIVTDRLNKKYNDTNLTL